MIVYSSAKYISPFNPSNFFVCPSLYVCNVSTASYLFYNVAITALIKSVQPYSFPHFPYYLLFLKFLQWEK